MMKTRNLWTSWALLALIGTSAGITLVQSSAARAENCQSQRQSGAESRQVAAAARPAKKMKQRRPDIIQTAVGPGMQTVTTLVKAVQAAELVDALRQPGPFTVFAPTNDAFAKLPAGTVENLLKPENKDQLRSILLYHVHAGDAIRAQDLKEGKLSTANGAPVKVKHDGPTVMIDNATVTKTDVLASNGVIHWIDTVILP